MTDQNAKPSVDPANLGSMQGMMRHVLDKYMQDVDDMLPAQVIAFNGDRNNPRVSVQVMYMMTTTGGDVIPMSQVANVPVQSVSGGGFVLSFPVKSGDLGWIKANDQDISLFLQSFTAQPGNTKRMHSFEDAVFIPDLMRGWAISGSDQEKAVLQSLDGAVKLTLSTTEIRMQAGASYVNVKNAGVDIVSPYLKHNGINVGYNHNHAGSPTAPNGPVSNTGGPLP